MSRSGTRWTEADLRARGWVRYTLRQRGESAERLDALMDETGESLPTLIDRLVKEERQRRERRKA